MSLHIREKRNSSGSVSIQIVDRKNRGYKVIETIGCAKNDIEKEFYLTKASKRLQELQIKLYPTLFDVDKQEDNNELEFINLYNKELIPVGDELIYGKLFEDIGCSSINLKSDKYSLFKALVISRLLYPGSKLYLIDYLEYFKKESIDKNRVYRFLDSLYQEEIKSKIQECIFNHTKKIMNDNISVTFYDVTTLHFESESEDDLRRIGFSKEGKLNRPQIQLGLFTTLQGYPLSFEVYEGNKYEGHTLIDILEKFQQRFEISNKPIVVADRGMLSNDNIAYLENSGYNYILAYKIKNIDNELKEKIANLTFVNDGVIHTIEIEKEINYKDSEGKNCKLKIKQRLILTYSTKRAKKDKRTREKALEKISAALDKKNITKSDLKLSYYAKYLDIDDKCTIKYKLNPNKVKLDAKLDGIKGFATNDFTLEAKDVIAHYQNQYAVEKAFRISKTDLKIRPIHHRLEHRIKTHILISFVAYAIYKEFEIKTRKLKKEYQISYKILRDLIKHIFAIKFDDGEIFSIKLSEIQQRFYDALHG